MYLSFIDEEIGKLQEKIDNLHRLESEIQGSLDAITDNLRGKMHDQLGELIEETLSNMEIDEYDTYVYDEYTQEMQEAFSDYVRMDL